MKRVYAVAAALIMAGAVATSPAVAGAAEPCVVPDDPDTTECLERFPLAGGATLPVYVSYPLDAAADVTKVIVVVHGAGRDAQRYYGMVAAAADARTEVISPRFQIEEDAPADTDAYWTDEGESPESWRAGGNAVRPEGLSSFDATDQLLTALHDEQKFPNLARITVIGHSAGGQFVQRYAAGGNAPDGIETRYVTANPSSYLYLTADRPGSVEDCAGYDDYKYGLNNLNDYMARLTPDQIRERYTSRPVTYLLGEEDVNQDHGIDASCAATAQGEHRLARGRSFAATIAEQYPNAPHAELLVPGVGHWPEEMFTSEQGRAVIFE